MVGYIHLEIVLADGVIGTHIAKLHYWLQWFSLQNSVDTRLTLQCEISHSMILVSRHNYNI